MNVFKSGAEYLSEVCKIRRSVQKHTSPGLLTSVKDALLCSPVLSFGFNQLEEKQCETSHPIKKGMSQDMAFP